MLDTLQIGDTVYCLARLGGDFGHNFCLCKGRYQVGPDERTSLKATYILDDDGFPWQPEKPEHFFASYEDAQAYHLEHEGFMVPKIRRYLAPVYAQFNTPKP